MSSPNLRLRAAVLLALLHAAVAAAAAQVVPSLSAGPGTARSGPSTTGAGLVLAPALRRTGARSDVSLGGTLGVLAAGGLTGDLSLRAERRLPRGLGTGRVDGLAVAYADGTRAGRAAAALRRSLGGGRLRPWAEAGAGVASPGERGRALATFGGGAELRVAGGSLSLCAAATSYGYTRVTEREVFHGDTLVPSDVERTEHSARGSYADARLGLRRAIGPAGLDAVAGLRVWSAARPPERWAEAGAAVALGHGAALQLRIGATPGLPEVGMGRARVATVALAYRPRSAPRRPTPTLAENAAFAVRPAGAGRVRLSLAVPGARTVEVKGDFSDWRPLALTPAGEGRWTLDLPLAPGTYRVEVRADGGEWAPPPGAPAVADDFGGTVGIFVVPAPAEG
jgi:hypothetical protein